jgi:hypothetical protein
VAPYWEVAAAVSLQSRVLDFALFATGFLCQTLASLALRLI